MKKFSKFILILLSLSLVLSPLAADEPLSPENPGKAPKVSGRPSVALVLSGGGALGFAEIPIIALLEELDIPVDMILGTSIGSIFGGLYAAGYTPDEILKEVSTIDWSTLFADTNHKPYESTFEEHSTYGNAISLKMGTNLKPRLGTGISNGQNAYAVLRRLSAKYPSNTDFDDFPIPFRAIATDMMTGNTDILHSGDIAEAIRASMSIPGVFQPWKIDDKYYVDGGVKDNLAIDIAKKMDFDIIIAIELRSPFSDNISTYESNPGVALLNMLAWSQIDSTREKYELADIVIHPELKGYNLLSFTKADEIYAIGEEAAVKYRPYLMELRKKIYPSDYDRSGNRISEVPLTKPRQLYRDLEPIKVDAISVENAYPADLNMIINQFNRAKSDGIVSDREFINLIEKIYFSGNYTSVMPRIIRKDDGTHELNIVLRKTEEKLVNIFMGLGLEQTLSSESGFDLDLNMGLQARDLTSPGSVVSLRGTFISDFGASLLFRQPVTPGIFIEGKSDFKSDRYSRTGKINDGSNAWNTEVNYWKNKIVLGIRDNHGGIIRAGGFFDTAVNPLLQTAIWMNNTEFNDSAVLAKYQGKSVKQIGGSAFGATLRGKFDNFNTNAFPTKGLSVDAVLKYCVPYSLSWEMMDQFLLGSIDIKASIPVSRKFTIKAGVMAGTDFFNNLGKNPLLLPVEGFSTHNRTFFPQVISLGELGSDVVAGVFMLQFKPIDSLTILGIEPYLRLTGTVGRTARSREGLFESMTSVQMGNVSWLWSGSLDLGLRISDGFSILMRGGVCSNLRMKENDVCTGFFSLDIGAFLF